MSRNRRGKRQLLGYNMASALTRMFSARRPVKVRKTLPVAVHPFGTKKEWFTRDKKTMLWK